MLFRSASRNPKYDYPELIECASMQSITIVYTPDSLWEITLPNKQLPEKVQLEAKELVGLFGISPLRF